LGGASGLQAVVAGLNFGSPHVVFDAQGLNFLLVVVDQPIEVMVVLHVRADPLVVEDVRFGQGHNEMGGVGT
jgi:hypothetical protein